MTKHPVRIRRGDDDEQSNSRPPSRAQRGSAASAPGEGAPASGRLGIGAQPQAGEVRLQKILSAAGVASRRAAERLMRERRVTVNGQVVTELGARADPERDVVRVDERRVERQPRRRYMLLYKPRGVVTTRSDPQGRTTVLDLMPRVRQYVYPVGRLDYDSEGLLLLTNDGALAERLTHPRHALERVYEAVVRGIPGETQLRRLRAGVHLDGRRTAPVEVCLVGGHRARRTDQARIEIVLREGRNRQVRRMLSAIGHPVVRLRRVQFGPLRAHSLKTGEYRELSARELAALRAAAFAADHPERPSA